MSNHPGSIDRHGARWRIRLSVDGKRHKFYLDGDTDLEDVEGFARSKYDELRVRAGRGLPGPCSFSDLLARYRAAGMPGKKKAQLAPLTKASYETSLKALETFFVDEGGNPGAHKVTKGHVNAFMLWRRNHRPDGTHLKDPVSARTVAKDRTILHRLYGFAIGLDIVDTNPVSATDAPEGDKREPVLLTPKQYEDLLEACEEQPMLYLYVLVLGETGVRCDSEALWLRWEDVDLERGLLNIESVRKGRRTKSGKSRRVPMAPRLRQAFRDHMARYRFKTYHGSRTPWVFHHEIDRRNAEAGDRLGGLRRAFYGAAKRAKLPSDLRQHDLRHRRVTVWLAEGKPAHIVQKAMGHSDLRTTLEYEHMVDDDLLQLVEAPTKAAAG